MIRFSGVKAGEACTIILRGATSQLLEEADRSLHDALAVMSQTVKETKTTLGGGTAAGLGGRLARHVASMCPAAQPPTFAPSPGWRAARARAGFDRVC